MMIQLTSDERLVLTSLFGRPSVAAKAYRNWRARVPLDQIDGNAYRMMPMLVEAAKRQPLADPDLPRMRGVAKSVWAHNTLRLRGLLPVLAQLRRNGIECVLLKGAAMFAREAERMGQRCTYDFDLLIRRSDLLPVLAAFQAHGFIQVGVRADRFNDNDFEALHAVMVERHRAENYELHWWPTPHLRDEAYIEGIFTRAETVNMIGHEVSVPSLADHLVLAILRAHGNRLEWALDTHWLLQQFGASLDWRCFVELAVGLRIAYRSMRYLRALVRLTNAPVPAWVATELGRRSRPVEPLEFLITERDVFQETRLKKFLFEATAIVLSEPELAASASAASLSWKILSGPATRRRITRAARVQFRPDRRKLADIWRQHCSLGADGSQDRVAFGEGWSLPDDVGRWTEKNLAVFAVPVDAPYGALCRIEAVVRPFLPGGRTTFGVRYTDGQETRTITLNAGLEFPVRWQIEGRAIGSQNRHVLIAMELLDTGRPVDFRISLDDRTLGINLESARLLDWRRPA